jgi:phi13 family phage major tail protein
MSRNKVRFNLHNVHYAPLSFSGSTPIFSTPVPIPGAVALSLSINGEAETFFADGGPYYELNNNMGYNGDLEIALIPEDFRTGPMGESLDDNNVLIERSDTELSPFALLFEFDGDQKHIRHVLYNCTAGRAAIEGKTNEEKRSVQTEKLSIRAKPLPDGRVKGRTGEDTDATVYAGWYNAVYLPDDSEKAARLSALTITGVTLTPSFSAYEYAYAAETTDTTNAVTATGATGTSVQLLVNGSAHTSGESAEWSSGINTVVAIVTKSGCVSKTYTVNVNKKSAS